MKLKEMNTFLKVITKEIEDLTFLKNKYGSLDCSTAIKIIQNCKGKVVVTGVGKSGHIGAKIAATFASVGIPSFFVHPAEACHGDLGMIEPKDVIIAISHSGESSELLLFLPFCCEAGNKLISITSNENSSLAKISDICLCTFITSEADILNLAPTSSTTATLVLGDALAIAVANSNGFSSEDFAKSHPSGTLGKRLLLTNKMIMRKDQDLPIVNQGTSLSEAILTMSEKKLGFIIVVPKNSRYLVGVFTDGDLRRFFYENTYKDLNKLLIDDLMNRTCQSVKIDAKAFDSLEILKTKQINSLVVTDYDNNVVGAIILRDLISFGL